MNSFTLELVSSASMNVYPQNAMSSFTNFLPEQINLEGDWEVALSEIAYPALYHNISDGRFRYKQNENDTDLEIMEIPAGLYHSLADILLSMRDAASKRKSKLIDFTWMPNHRTHMVKITLPNADAALKFISPDIAHILGFLMSFLLNGIGPHKSHYPVDIPRFHAIVIYSNIVRPGIFGDTKAPILRSFPFIPKLKNEAIVTGQFMNYHTFSNLHYKPLLTNSFHSISIDMRTNTTGELIPFVAVGYTRLTLQFRKVGYLI